ncbi:MAG: hypothetical protein IKQ80_04555 [Clostridia bacterium]|nr:hypothetical protein [Clostridia bacterium]
MEVTNGRRAVNRFTSAGKELTPWTSLPLPIAGLMSDLPGEAVAERLKALHDAAHERLGISMEVEPVMTLCFMSLIVIPELKITTRGLFDVSKFDFVPLEAD